MQARLEEAAVEVLLHLTIGAGGGKPAWQALH